MKFTLSNEVFEAAPDTQVGILIAKNLDNSKNPDQTYQILWHYVEQQAQKYNKQGLQKLKEITSWHKAFQNAGRDPKKSPPSHEALLDRVAERKDIPSINPLIN